MLAVQYFIEECIFGVASGHATYAWFEHRGLVPVSGSILGFSFSLCALLSASIYVVAIV